MSNMQKETLYRKQTNIAIPCVAQNHVPEKFKSMTCEPNSSTTSISKFSRTEKSTLFALLIFTLFLLLQSQQVHAVETPKVSHNVASNKLMSVAGCAGVDEIARLIHEGADVNTADRNGMTPLIYAIENNSSLDVLRVFIENSADVNAADEDRKTPLIYAVGSDSNLDVVRILIENGADVNAVDIYKKSPLMIASNKSNLDTVRVLIENGANVNAFDIRCDSPLIHAVGYNSSLDIVHTLIRNNANVNAANVYGYTPLMFAALRANFDTIRTLIDNGANVNTVNKDGVTTLMYAAENSTNPDVMKLLIESGANVNATDNRGASPLLYAARNNANPEVLRFFIEMGADVNRADKYGETPLIAAANKNSNPDVVRVLIENSADIGFMDKEGKRALDYAVENVKFARFSRGARVTDNLNLDLYHPWSRSSQSLLVFPASLQISGDYPVLDGATLSYPLYANIVDNIFAETEKTELKRYLACSRTEGAYNNLIRGEVDMIFVLQPSDEQLESAKDVGVELHFTPIAKDAFVFLVNDRNPVSNLSIKQVRDIYMKKIINWREVGGNDRRIMTYQRPVNSGSQTAMIKEVMKGENLPPPLKENRDGVFIEWEHRVINDINAPFMDEHGNILENLHEEIFSMIGMILEVSQYRDNEESIGYSFRYFAEDMMSDFFTEKMIKADFFQILIDLIPADDPESNEKREKYQDEIQNTMRPVKLLSIDGIAPSIDNIRNGTYPFTVDMFAVTAGTRNPYVQKLIDWLLSQEGQELIEKAGYIGVVK